MGGRGDGRGWGKLQEGGTTGGELLEGGQRATGELLAHGFVCRASSIDIKNKEILRKSWLRIILSLKDKNDIYSLEIYH